MDTYEINLGKKASVAAVDMMADKVKLAIQQEKTAVILVDNINGSADSMLIGDPVSIMSKLGSAVIDSAKQMQKDNNKKIADATMAGFLESVEKCWRSQG